MGRMYGVLQMARFDLLAMAMEDVVLKDVRCPELSVVVVAVANEHWKLLGSSRNRREEQYEHEKYSAPSCFHTSDGHFGAMNCFAFSICLRRHSEALNSIDAEDSILAKDDLRLMPSACVISF
jgi:hypothetical protein